MPHGIVALAVASVPVILLVAVIVAVRDRGLLVAARRPLHEHRALLASSQRHIRMFAVVAGTVTVGETDPVSVARRRLPVERPAATRILFTADDAIAVAAVVCRGARGGWPAAVDTLAAT